MLHQLLNRLSAGEALFTDVIAFIDERYDHTPTAFVNGAQKNLSEENQGSAKVLSLAKLAGLSAGDTLRLFAEHYESVLSDPNGTNHQNIRQFMQNGWEGVVFEKEALKPRGL